MNKKLCCLVVIFAILALATVAFGAEEAVTFNADYTEAYYMGNTYVLEESLQSFNLDYNWISVELTQEQDEEISTISCRGNEYCLKVSISFFHGGQANLGYVEINSRSIIEEALAGRYEEYILYAFEDYYKDNPITVSFADLMGKKITVNGMDIAKYQYSFVEGSLFNGELENYNVGELILYENNRVLFVNYYTCVPSQGKVVEYAYYSDVVCYEITDQALIEQLLYEEESEEGSLLGNVLAIILVIFLSLVFVVIPLVAAILSAIFAHRAKTPIYKKLLRIISTLLWVALAVLAIAVVVIIVVVGMEAFNL